MNFNLELPDDVLIISKKDLKEVLKGLLTEINEEMAHEHVMTIKETAEYLQVSVPTVRAWIETNDIPFFKRGQVYRLHRSEVDAWMKGGQ